MRNIAMFRPFPTGYLFEFKNGTRFFSACFSGLCKISFKQSGNDRPDSLRLVIYFHIAK